MNTRILFAVLCCAAFASSCRTVKPKRFSNLAVVPAPTNVLDMNPHELAPAGVEATLLSSLTSRYAGAYTYMKPWYKSGSVVAGNLFCAPGGCAASNFLTASVFAEAAPPPPASIKTSAFMRSMERAQAQMARAVLTERKSGSDVAESFSALLKAIDDRKEESPADLVKPRVSVTASHTLSLPGEWDRVQYLAIYLALHSDDVTFNDTNEFESIFRDIDLGTLTEKASNKIAGSAKATAGVAFGKEDLGGKTTKSAEAGISAEAAYEETLVRALKEQLQFRSSAIESNGRLFGIVLKSAQQNKLPTLLRQILTIKYGRSLSGRLSIPIVDKDGLAGIRFADQPLRGATLAPRDGTGDAGYFLTSATPFLIGVVRRVTNAKGVNTSVEDDDNVSYTTQALRLPAITLDRVSKCEYELEVGSGEHVTFQQANMGVSKRIVVTDRAQAEVLQRALQEALAKATAAQMTSGEIFGSGPEGLKKSLWGYESLAALAGPTKTDWTSMAKAVKLSEVCK